MKLNFIKDIKNIYIAGESYAGYFQMYNKENIYQQ